MYIRSERHLLLLAALLFILLVLFVVTPTPLGQLVLELFQLD
jgi:hypothetical protein